jgi:outer membrane protein assembly factor BamB
MGELIHQTLELPNGRIVILKWSDKTYRDENLFCYRADGSLKWKAELPPNTGQDFFVAVALVGAELRANTWSCYALWLDPETGRTLRSHFTK